ncbi:MAG: DMT family transporter [Stackebrandtia sp.]
MTPAVPRQRSARPRLIVPAWAALVLVVVGGACAAGQAAVNGELGARIDSPLTAAAISNTLGGMVFIIALLAVPRVREGLRRVRRQRLPLWMYSGGIFGAVYVFAGSLTVPLLGVALFTVAQVCGNTMGALGTDATGVGPSGKLRVTRPRLIGALLAILAIAIAQIGRDVATGLWWLVPFVVVVGAGLALQGAFNGRVNEVTGNPLSTGMVNFVSGTSVLYVVVGIVGLVQGLPLTELPPQAWLYLGGPLGALLVIFSMLAIKTIGVLRTALGILTGQLVGALVIDVVAVATAPSPWLVAGVVLTAAAVGITGRGKSAADPTPDADISAAASRE